MKQFTREDLDRIIAEIPRRNRRGLIEAIPEAVREATSIVRFPGEIAGASLKLRRSRRRRAGAPSDSPAKSPGPH